MKRILFLLLVLCLPLVVMAEDVTDTETVPKPAPIHMHMDLGLFGILGSSMDYNLRGKKLNTYEDFKKVIYPLRDEEASEQIRQAEESHFGALLFYGAGALTGIDIALFFPPTPFLHVDWTDRILTGAFVAQFFVGAGALFDNNAAGHKFNAVQRYNGLIRREPDDRLDFTPQVSWTNNGPTLALVHSF